MNVIIAIIAAIAVSSIIATLAVIAVIAIIDTSVDAEDVALCIESAERKYQTNRVQLSSCTEWAGGLGGADTFNRAAVFATLRLRPVAVAGAEAVGPQPIT